MSHLFGRFATRTADVVGSPWCFVGILALYAVWALSGPLLHFSDTWQLIINTATTLWTGALIALLQHTQNRDTEAIKAMLRELVTKLPETDSRVAEEGDDHADRPAD